MNTEATSANVGRNEGPGVLVCIADGCPYYGAELEAVAARLERGATVCFRGRIEEVETVWFYDGPVINLKSGRKIFPALGDTFAVLVRRDL